MNDCRLKQCTRARGVRDNAGGRSPVGTDVQTSWSAICIRQYLHGGAVEESAGVSGARTIVVVPPAPLSSSRRPRPPRPEHCCTRVDIARVLYRNIIIVRHTPVRFVRKYDDNARARGSESRRRALSPARRFPSLPAPIAVRARRRRERRVSPYRQSDL